MVEDYWKRVLESSKKKSQIPHHRPKAENADGHRREMEASKDRNEAKGHAWFEIKIFFMPGTDPYFA